MSGLTKEAIKKLRVVQKQILVQPELYDQGIFGSYYDPCNTPACIAGWLVRNESAELYVKSVRADSCSFEAEDILNADTGNLFASAEYWPRYYAVRYYAAGTKLERAKVAAEVIDHFIANGGTL